MRSVTFFAGDLLVTNDAALVGAYTDYSGCGVLSGGRIKAMKLGSLRSHSHTIHRTGAPHLNPPHPAVPTSPHITSHHLSSLAPSTADPLLAVS